MPLILAGLRVVLEHLNSVLFCGNLKGAQA
jgi:hypothetical protein